MFDWLRRLFRRDATDGITAQSRLLQQGATQSLNRLEPAISATLTRPPWLARVPATILFVDVETTGFRAGADRIVSYAGILLKTADLAEGELAIGYNHYIVDPCRICHPRAVEVHGYSDWLLRHQQPFSEVVDRVLAQIEDADLIVAHNAEFDLGFINAELASLGRPHIAKPVYCTVEGCRTRGAGSARLDDVAARIGLSRAGPRHGALEDAWLAMMVYLWLHGCPHRLPFSNVSHPQPTNLRPAPPIPEQALAMEQAAAAMREMFSRTDAAPPRMSRNFSPRGMASPDGGDLRAVPIGPADDDLCGTTFAIEYTDAGGRESTRRITLKKLRQTGDGRTYLVCLCHECGETRTFRFDRIRSVIDLDGVVHEPDTFFGVELRSPIAPMLFGTPSVYSERPGMAQRRVARDGLRVLAALARSDGIMHPAEVEVIIDYIAERAARERLATGDEDRLALGAYLKRQRPGSDTLDECLARLARSPAEDQRLFLRSAIALAEADGQRDTAEVAMLFQFQERLAVEV